MAFTTSEKSFEAYADFARGLNGGSGDPSDSVTLYSEAAPILEDGQAFYTLRPHLIEDGSLNGYLAIIKFPLERVLGMKLWESDQASELKVELDNQEVLKHTASTVPAKKAR